MSPERPHPEHADLVSPETATEVAVAADRWLAGRRWVEARLEPFNRSIDITVMHVRPDDPELDSHYDIILESQDERSGASFRTVFLVFAESVVTHYESTLGPDAPAGSDEMVDEFRDWLADLGLAPDIATEDRAKALAALIDRLAEVQ